MPRCIATAPFVLAPQLSGIFTLYEYDDMMTLCMAIGHNWREVEYALPSPADNVTHYARRIYMVVQLAVHALVKQLDIGAALCVVSTIEGQGGRSTPPGDYSSFNKLAEWCMHNYPSATGGVCK
jgi:hypothetical protein